MKRVPQGMVVVAEQHSASSCVAELYTGIKIKLVGFMCILLQVFKFKNFAPTYANKLQRTEAARRCLECHQINKNQANACAQEGDQVCKCYCKEWRDSVHSVSLSLENMGQHEHVCSY